MKQIMNKLPSGIIITFQDLAATLESALSGEELMRFRSPVCDSSRWAGSLRFGLHCVTSAK